MHPLIQDIEQKRAEMIRYAEKHGLSSAITVKCSQELDRLLNQLK